MKKKILLSITLFFLTITNNLFAQEIWGAAISTSGIILGDYKIANSSVNPIPVTITLDEAKNIFALNILQSGKDRKFSLVKVKGYQMTIVNKDETSTSITNTTELLSEEMKLLLKNLRSGSKLYFDGISGIGQDGSTRSIAVMSFTIN